MQTKLDFKLGLFDLTSHKVSLRHLESLPEGSLDRRYYVQAQHHSR